MRRIEMIERRGGKYREEMKKKGNLNEDAVRQKFAQIANPRKTAKSCHEQKNFVFIKGMKIAGTTLLGIFDRFGVTRNLSFVLPQGHKLYLNWPFPLTKWDYRQNPQGFNILVDHAIYTEDVMSSIMPKDTIYITIIRHPMTHLKSLVKYFEMPKLSGIPSSVENPVLEYFSDLPRYEAAYQRPGNKERYCIPDHFSMTRNLMSHCLGLPLGFPPGRKNVTGNAAEIQRHLRHLEDKFRLVMIADHFTESLVLLKRHMCWSFSDIVYSSANVAFYKYKNWRAPESFLEKHRQWSDADYQLFEHFNQTLWRKIEQEGEDFFAEVDAFRPVQGQVKEFCEGVYQHAKEKKPLPDALKVLVIPASEWTREFSVTAKDCELLGPDPYVTQRRLQTESDKLAKTSRGKLQILEPDPRQRYEKAVC